VETLIEVLGVIALAVVAVLAGSLLMAFPVKWIWNDLAVTIFSANPITVFQAWEMAFLCGILFKSGSSE
jgi:hypothetical protein